MGEKRSGEKMEKRDRQLKTAFLIFFLLLLGLSAGLLVTAYVRGYFASAETLRAYVSSFGPFAPLMLTAIQTMQAFLPIIPSLFGYAAGAGLFGIWGGFLCSYIGICAGSVIAYFLARQFGVGFVRQILSEKRYNAAVRWAESRKNFTTVLWLAILLPLAPDCALCYLSGLIKMPARKFIFIILAAKPWCILLYSVLFGTLL